VASWPQLHGGHKAAFQVSGDLALLNRIRSIVPVLALSLSTPVFAHGEAEWIMKNPDYVDSVGYPCCGPEDCERIPDHYVRDMGQEIHVLPTGQVFRKDGRGAYPSRDTSWWWCKRRKWPSFISQPASCIFYPFNGQ